MIVSTLWCAVLILYWQGAQAYFDRELGDVQWKIDANSTEVPSVKYIFVLFSETRDPHKNANIDIFNNASATITTNYYHSSTLFLVFSHDDRQLSTWNHPCPKGATGSVRPDCLVCFEKPLEDRTCLMAPPVTPLDRLPGIMFAGNLSDREDVVSFMKVESEVYLQDVSPGSSLTDLLYALPPVQLTDQAQSRTLTQCADVDAHDVDFDMFFREYWLPQRPVIIRQVRNVTSLPLLQLLHKYRHVTVGAKLSPDVEFEGVDSLQHWGMAGQQDVPKKVLGQLQSPHLVVVRAAHEDMSLGRVLWLLTTSADQGGAQHEEQPEEQTRNQTPKQRQRQSPTEKGPGPADAAAEVVSNVYVEYMHLDSEALAPLYRDLMNISDLHQDCLGDEHCSTSTIPNTGVSASKYPGFPAWVDALRDGTPYLWLGDGLAVGKMHFDPFDNLLLQLEGSKTFRLVDPSDNRRMYEGHMREAQLEALSSPSSPAQHSSSGDDSGSSRDGGRRVGRRQGSGHGRGSEGSNMGGGQHQYLFRKHRLLESTSMVHTPVTSVEHPDVRAFPLARDTPFVDCKVGAGDMIFVPSFWWHEVASAPGPTRRTFPPDSGDNHDAHMHLNVAINHWFDPLFLKEYPCASCRKYVNKKYARLLIEQQQLAPLRSGSTSSDSIAADS